MIHLDTNALIALPRWARNKHPVVDRVVNGEAAAVSAAVWYEYIAGPLADGEARLAHAFVRGSIVPVTKDTAVLAAKLFNDAGRRRKLKTDALIAACALHADADFVTSNIVDFEPFKAHGLRLVEA